MNVFLHRVHRLVGLGAACFVFLLALTGIALLFDQTLKLDRRYITTSALLDWYAIRLPPPPYGFAVNDHWVAQVGPRLYFERQMIADHSRPLRGAIAIDGLFVVALNDEIWLLNPSGERIERLTAVDGVPSDMIAIGISADRMPVLHAGATTFSLDLADLEIRVIEPPPTRWAAPGRVPAALESAYADDFRGTQLTLERLIVDVHSGRILGAFGLGIVSISALAMMVLAVTGLLSWWRRYRRQHRAPRRS